MLTMQNTESIKRIPQGYQSLIDYLKSSPENVYIFVIRDFSSDPFNRATKTSWLIFSDPEVTFPIAKRPKNDE